MIHRMNLAALFFMAVLLLTGCTNKEKTDFSKYITGYTSGVIKSSSSLSVYLGQPSDKGFQAGSTLPADLFRISPAIKGELILKDNHSIEFGLCQAISSSNFSFFGKARREEMFVDLDFIKKNILQRIQRRIPRSEIVHMQFES